MRTWIWGLAICLLFTPEASADEGPDAVRPVATYSIVARDAATGQLGVAVQSHWFAVGSVVAWAEAGVGAVATQSLVDVTYGPLGLELLRAGRPADAALSGLLTADAHPEIRQVALVDAEGRVAVHTGGRCIAEAGHRTGEGYSVQANLMDRDTVPDAMATAFEAAEGSLAERMLTALAAAEAEGGDIRGRQSAALLVVAGESTGRPWADTVVDLHVEDHPDPIGELRRLHRIHTGYEAMNRGDLALEHGDLVAAERAYATAQEILGDNLEAGFWNAVSLVNAGEVDRAVPLFHDVFARGGNWKRLVPRLVDAGLFPDDPAILDRVLAD